MKDDQLEKPALFGLKFSNRDFTKKEYWGKNQFNSSFPTSLLCYMYSKGINPQYIKINNNFEIQHEFITVEDLFGVNPLDSNVFYGFETPYNKYQQYFTGVFPRNDLTISQKDTGNVLSTFEIKLTALPDNQTCMLSEDQFGTELVIRPDTIIYQASMIIDEIDVSTLKRIYQKNYEKIKDWTEASNVLPYIKQMVNDYKQIISLSCDKQKPLIIQPVWKTKGKNPTLSDDCLDVFVWSSFSMAKLYIPAKLSNITKINRRIRTLVWLTKMLVDYVNDGKFSGYEIIDLLSYNTKNDKAFSIGGDGTHQYMASKILESPRIKKTEIKNIILGGGQNLLSPERRFDAIIYNTPSLFEEN